GAAVAVAFARDIALPLRGLAASARLVRSVWIELALGFVLAGLIEVLLPQPVLSRWLGPERVGHGILIGWAAGLVMPGGPYVLFPIAADLFRHGAAPAPLITLLTAKTLVSPIRTLTYEAPLLGWPLTLARFAPGRGADVSDARLLNAERDAGNWLMYNRTYAGWRFSPLDQISAANIKKLVPKWIFAGGTVGDQQMTPVVNDGVMFTTSTSLAFNRVHAVNAATGELLWKYDRRTAEDVGALVRLIPHNRGVALYKDKVIFGTLDAHLVALDAKTGKPAWETKIVDYSDGYYVSQAPLVIKGKVVVGIAGPGEMGPRGFVEA